MVHECVVITFTVQGNVNQKIELVQEDKKYLQPEAISSQSDASTDLIGTPLECPFDLNVLKIQDEEFYSKDIMGSPHHSELKSCVYKPFSSFEARYVGL